MRFWGWKKSLPCQGHKLLTNEELANMPKQDWMVSSTKPPVHQWLLKKAGDNTKDRLRVAGNVVIHQMAYVAANMLAKMSNFNWENMDDYYSC